ncbi:MAG: methyltransferase type 12 [Gemmobacter sp.]|nr:methyltransferase type 12 [Gemmobacter sp.]
MRSDLALFMRQVLRRPQQVSALAPSSRALAMAMTVGLGPDTGRVVEFGPGTGRITRAILARGVAPENLTLIELNPDFAAKLRADLPGVRVIVAGAQEVAEHCKKGAGAVISGLPLLSMPVDLRRAIVTGAFAALRPEGRMVQFTYGPRPPLSDDIRTEMGLVIERGAMVWGNLPPARVYSFFRNRH